MATTSTSTPEISTDPSPPLDPSPEVHGDVSSKGTPTDKASQDSLKPTEGNKEVQVDVSPEGTATEVDEEWIEKGSEEGYSIEEGSEEGYSTDSEVGTKAVVNEMHRPLFIAALTGNWETVEEILSKHPEAMSSEVMTIHRVSLTMLEVAVMAAQEQFVKNLVNHLPLRYDGWSWSFLMALQSAALRGRMGIVKALVDKVNPEPDSVDFALWVATEHSPTQKEVIWYLAKRTSSDPDYRTMRCLIMAGHLDIVLYLVDKYLNSGTSPSRVHSMMGKLLGNLVTMKSHFHSGAKLNFWEKVIYKFLDIPPSLVVRSVDSSEDTSKDTRMAQALERLKISLQNLVTKPGLLIKRIGELKLRHKCSLEFANRVLDKMKADKETPKILKLTSDIVLDAASHGISEIVKLCLKHFPELTWDANFTNKLMKEVVTGRHVELYRLVNTHDTFAFPYLTDHKRTKHRLMEAVVGWSPVCAPADVSGAAFVMQRELQWFKVLEDRSDPSFKIQKLQVREESSDPSFKIMKLVQTRKRGKTYWEIFVEQRQDLLKEAGQWMKDTSSSCSVVATLILTVAFAAIFTVPGGNDGSTGIPIFLKRVHSWHSRLQMLLLSSPLSPPPWSSWLF
ncbi:hypothetical protein NL676_033000 [Syzygium grande]|nr:hypothetical protein NL676_033000 [Syzygium grande]